MLPVNPMDIYRLFSTIKSVRELYLARMDATKRYHKSLIDRYGNLDLSGFDPGDSRLVKSAAEQEQIKLREMFVEPNVREDGAQERSDEIDSEQIEPAVSNLEASEQYYYLNTLKSSEPVLKVLTEENCRCVVILGGPGSGKSTLVQNLALGWAEEETKQFPLLIELGEYTNSRHNSESFLDFWYRTAGVIWRFDREKFQKDLNNENSLVMFDGLDEITDRQAYRDLVNQIIDFAEEYARVRIIVTSRLGGYNPERLRNAQFRHLSLQDLRKSQIALFIDRCYNLLLKNDADKERLKQRMRQAIEDSTAVENLASNPQILMMMAIILNRQGSLPTERELYYLASRVRLDNADREDLVIDAIERQEKQAMLGIIACEMQFRSPARGGNSIDDESLKDLLTKYLEYKKFREPRETAMHTIQQLQADNFILCVSPATRTDNFAGDTYSFVHRKFLGYFCAMEVARLFEKKQSLSFEQLQDNIFGRYWRDEHRHRSLRLICGLLKPESAGKLVEFLMGQEVERIDYLDREDRASVAAFQHLQLAGECLAEVRGDHSVFTLAVKLKEKLKDEIDRKIGIPLSFEAAKLLTNSIAKYYRSLPDTNSIAQYYLTKSNTLSWLKDLALQNGDRLVRAAAIGSIAEYYRLKSDTLDWLKNTAFSSLYEDVRSAAVESIAKYYIAEVGVLSWLKNRAFADPHELVRRTMVESLAKHYSTDINTLSWLKNSAFIDPHEWVRWAVVESIGKYYSAEIAIFGWFKDRAFADRHELVRRAVVESIGKYYSKEIDGLSWLKNCAFSDRHQLVRWAAVWSIAELEREQVETINWLKGTAFGDRHVDVRVAVIQSIVKYYFLDPDRLIQSQNRALYNPNEATRREEVRLLIDYSVTLNWLKNCAVQDLDELVRRNAIRSIAGYYRALPEILTWLQDCAFEAQQHPDVRQTIVRALTQPLSSNIAGADRTSAQILRWVKQQAIVDADPLVRRAAVQSLAKYYRDGTIATKPQMGFEIQSPPSISSTNLSDKFLADTLTWIHRALNDPHELVRRAGLESLVKYYHTEPKTLSWLHRALDDPHELVRRTGVDALAKYYYNLPETIERLKHAAIADLDKDVRRTAVQAIAKYYHAESDTLIWFKDRAFGDPHDWVRKTAVRSIAEHYHRASDMAIWLQTHTFNAPAEDIEIRRAAVDTIAKYYRTEPSTLPWLEHTAFQHPHEWVRRTVVESIAKYYTTEPTTLDWLKRDAFKDRHKLVRRTAIRSISEYFIQSEGVFELLCQVAAPELIGSRTTDLKPRQIALKALDKHYADRPETDRLWLQATEDPNAGLRKWAEDHPRNREEPPLI